jgi:hypothetical protein
MALDAYADVSKQLLNDAGGYLVELTSSGLVLAAFRHPLDAVAWGAGLIEVMKNREWDEVRNWWEGSCCVHERKPSHDMSAARGACNGGGVPKWHAVLVTPRKYLPVPCTHRTPPPPPPPSPAGAAQP